MLLAELRQRFLLDLGQLSQNVFSNASGCLLRLGIV